VAAPPGAAGQAHAYGLSCHRVVSTRSSRPSAFLAGSGGPVQIDDFDAIPTLSPGWDQAHVQLGRGTPCARTTFAHTPWMELAVISRAPGVLLQGAPPRGTTVVAVNLQGPALHLQRHPWERDLLGVVPRGGEFEIVSTAPHTLFGLCVDQDRLDEAALTHWGQRFPARFSGAGLRFRDAASRRRLIATWARWLNRARRQPGTCTDPGLVALMEQEVIGAVMGNVETAVRAPPVRPRREIALRAEAFLRRSLEEPVHIDDVCAAARASRQTLHASFRAAFGTSPMAYAKSLRLSAARRDLERARPGTTVAAVAMKWGFFRLGYFSRDYRAMFGEQPSETLHRAHGRVLASARSRPTGHPA
jgi:AraC family ethanolamine operon transcriptional activator